MKTCPFCAEEVQDAAIKCKHCGEFFEAKAETKLPEPPASEAIREVVADTQVRPDVVTVDPNQVKGASAVILGGFLGFCGCMLGSSAGSSPEIGIVVGGIFAALGAAAAYQAPNSEVKQTVSNYRSECPHCSSRVLILPAEFEQMKAEGKPKFCSKCKNAFGASGDGERLEKVAVGLKVEEIKKP